MGCKDYAQMISEEIDSELEESRALFLMRHLVSCNDCLGEYKGVLSLKGLVHEDAAKLQMTVPFDFSAKVMAAIESELAAEAPGVAPVAQVLPNPLAVLIGRLKDFALFPKPSLSWSMVATALVVFSMTIFYNKSTSDHTSAPQFADAKVIQAKVLKAATADAGNEGDDLAYYVNRHSNAVYSRSSNVSMGRRSGNLVYASYAGGIR